MPSLMDPNWILFLFAAFMALGWTFVNGLHRRDSANKNGIAKSISRFPKFTQRKLLRLLVPTSFIDRWNHATVIAGCVTIIGVPVAIVAVLLGNVAWWAAPLILIGGSLLGAYLGEAMFNFGCSVDLPDNATAAPKADEGGHEGPNHTQQSAHS